MAVCADAFSGGEAAVCIRILLKVYRDRYSIFNNAPGLFYEHFLKGLLDLDIVSCFIIYSELTCLQ